MSERVGLRDGRGLDVARVANFRQGLDLARVVATANSLMDTWATSSTAPDNPKRDMYAGRRRPAGIGRLVQIAKDADVF